MSKKWFTGPEARFAQALQKELLQHSMAPWHRRGAALLDINCGDGLFLPLLWQCGFDVSGTERSPQARTQAMQAAPKGTEIQAAAADHLPFADKSFDWAVLHLDGTAAPDVEAAVREALRVTTRGLAVTFWNAVSLPNLLRRLTLRSMPWPGTAHAWWPIWRLLSGFNAFKMTLQSTLCGPIGSWHRQCPMAPWNSRLRSLPLGAWCIIRLDLAPLRGQRGLALRLRHARLHNPEPVMEYGSSSLRQTVNKEGNS